VVIRLEVFSDTPRIAATASADGLDLLGTDYYGVKCDHLPLKGAHGGFGVVTM